MDHDEEAVDEDEDGGQDIGLHPEPVIAPIGSAGTRLVDTGVTTFEDSALDETIAFFRNRQRYEFDSDESETNQTYTQAQINEELGIPEGWEDSEPDIYIYIDDANAVEKVQIPGSITTISQHKQLVRIHASQSEELFNTVSIRASGINMKVNNDKTQLLCISSNYTSETSSYIRAGSQKITSGQGLKILGFKFGSRPTVRDHVDFMLDKARKKLWTVRHLKKNGMESEDLIKIFNSVIRPTLEYACPTYHPMLNNEMTAEIERVQKQACKIIYGFDCDYERLINNNKIETLASRREKLTLNFAEKTQKNPRFAHWFPLRTHEGPELRRNLKVEETYARTERLRRSPVHYMRRALNKKAEEDKN